MKIYRIVVAKDIFTKSIPQENKKEVRKAVASLFQLDNLFDSMGINDFYISNNHASSIMINEDALSKIQLLSTMNYGVPNVLNQLSLEAKEFNDSEYSHFDVKSSSDVISIMKEHMQQEHIKQIKELQKEAAKQSGMRKILVRSKMTNKVDRNLHHKKTVCIDFEYSNLDVFEFGITTYENSELSHNHYLIKENYIHKKTSPELQFKFGFGESNMVNESQVESIIKNHLKDADYLLFHGHGNDYLILCKYGFELEKAENLKMIDTIHFYQDNFKQRKGDAANLKKMLYEFNIPHENLHNSGNDAAFTMELFLEMHRRITHKRSFKVAV